MTQVKGWTLRPVTELNNTVHRIPPANPEASGAPPLRITLPLSETVILPSDPRVGWWDEVNGNWNSAGISQISVDPVGMLN